MNVSCSAKSNACPLLLSSACVFYEGENLIYIGVNMNDNLQTALEKLNVAFSTLQSKITLTTIGSSGPSTFISDTLNVPNYSLSGLGGNLQAVTDIGSVTTNVITAAGFTLTPQPIGSSTYRIGQVMATDDSWAIYGYADTVDNGDLFFELQDNAALINGQRFRFRYGNISSGTPKDILLMDYNSATFDGAVQVNDLAGTGTRMVVTDANGALSTQAIPSTSSGGSSVNYYLNGSVSASVAGYNQLSNSAIIGTGTDFTLSGNGLIAQFLTDVGNPNRLEIPGGAWNFEMYFQSSSTGGNTKFYVELLKYDGTTFTSIASSSAIPEQITGGTAIDLYLTSLAVPTTSLLATDRLAIRVYIVDNSGGRTITLHTEDNTLCEIITTFAGGISALNGLTANTQYFATGTSGTSFNIVSVGDTHTFNFPSGGGGSMAIGGSITSATAGSVLFAGTSGVLQQDNANFFWDDTNNRLGIGTATPTSTLQVNGITNVIYSDNSFGNGFLLQNSNTGTNAYTGIALKDSSSNIVAGFQYVPNNFAFAPLRNTVLFVSTGQSKLGFVANSAGIGGVRQDIYFSTYSGVNNMYLYGSTGNLVIQNGGTFADAGYRLDVNGTARIQGAIYGLTGTTDNAIDVKNPAATTRFSVRNDGIANFIYDNNSFSNGLFVRNTNTGTSSLVGFILKDSSDAAAGGMQFIPSNFSTTSLQNSVLFSSFGTKKIGIIANADATIATAQDIYFSTLGGNSTYQLQIKGNTGNVLINTNSDVGYRLDVNGTARVSGDAQFNGLNTYFGAANWRFEQNSTQWLFQKVGIGTYITFDTAATSKVTINQNTKIAGQLAFGATGDYGFESFSSGFNINESGVATRLRIVAGGNVLIGTSTSVASALLNVDSSTKGFLPPRMTTTQKNAIATPAAGLMVYDTTLNKLCVYSGTAWETITSI